MGRPLVAWHAAFGRSRVRSGLLLTRPPDGQVHVAWRKPCRQSGPVKGLALSWVCTGSRAEVEPVMCLIVMDGLQEAEDRLRCLNHQPDSIRPAWPGCRKTGRYCKGRYAMDRPGPGLFLQESQSFWPGRTEPVPVGRCREHGLPATGQGWCSCRTGHMPRLQQRQNRPRRQRSPR